MIFVFFFSYTFFWLTWNRKTMFLFNIGYFMKEKEEGEHCTKIGFCGICGPIDIHGNKAVTSAWSEREN